MSIPLAYGTEIPSPCKTMVPLSYKANDEAADALTYSVTIVSAIMVLTQIYWIVLVAT